MLVWLVGAVVFLVIYAILRQRRGGDARPISADLPRLAAILVISGIVALVGSVIR
jgi:Na+/proline symporter